MALDAGTRLILDLDILLDPYWSADRWAAWIRGGFKGRGGKVKIPPLRLCAHAISMQKSDFGGFSQFFVGHIIP